MIEQGGGHLRPPRVVDADEEHFRNVLHDASFSSVERPEVWSGGGVERTLVGGTPTPPAKSGDKTVSNAENPPDFRDGAADMRAASETFISVDIQHLAKHIDQCQYDRPMSI